jgi:hypothetical protein
MRRHPALARGNAMHTLRTINLRLKGANCNQGKKQGNRGFHGEDKGCDSGRHSKFHDHNSV